MTATDEPTEAEGDTTYPVLAEPAEGVPPVICTRESLIEACQSLARATGPVAIDAERASGHRYGQRAFLIQLRRGDAGTLLIDTDALPDLAPVAQALQGTEWILHASTQDLPCLGELGLRPDHLFDTELAGRILGLPKVGLASLTEQLLGVSLAKGHGAADWSKRPLPIAWLSYAALDVELLHELREVLIQRLEAADRWEWARQEFEHLLHWQPRERPEPWRRSAGKIRDPRGLAIVRELWLTREEIARAADQPPGRILPDALLSSMVLAAPASATELAALPGMRPQRRRTDRWWRAIQRGRAIPESELPERFLVEYPPPQRSWERREPAAAARLARVRAAINAHAESLGIPAEVLIAPDPVRLLVWEATTPPEPDEVAARLQAAGVRQWQIQQVSDLIAAALPEPKES